jgi:hypothetical protein
MQVLAHISEQDARAIGTAFVLLLSVAAVTLVVFFVWAVVWIVWLVRSRRKRPDE